MHRPVAGALGTLLITASLPSRCPSNWLPPVEVDSIWQAVPALLMIVLLYDTVSGPPVARRGHPIPRQPFDFRELVDALWEARWELPLPVVVLGGIFSGFLVVSEAAAVTALYVLVAEVFLYKEISLRKLPAIMRESMIMVGGILLILAVALAFTDYLVYAGVPEKLFTLIQTHVESKIAFLILLKSCCCCWGRCWISSRRW